MGLRGKARTTADRITIRSVCSAAQQGDGECVVDGLGHVEAVVAEGLHPAGVGGHLAQGEPGGPYRRRPSLLSMPPEDRIGAGQHRHPVGDPDGHEPGRASLHDRAHRGGRQSGWRASSSASFWALTVCPL